jgi:hypothetical protein
MEYIFYEMKKKNVTLMLLWEIKKNIMTESCTLNFVSVTGTLKRKIS